jgi:hypothetical protein
MPELPINQLTSYELYILLAFRFSFIFYSVDIYLSFPSEKSLLISFLSNLPTLVLGTSFK